MKMFTCCALLALLISFATTEAASVTISTIRPRPITTAATEEPAATTGGPSMTSVLPTEPSDPYCYNGGIEYCNCPQGYTGERCETPIDWCNSTQVIEGNELVPVGLCGPHGSCVYDPNTGSHCNCDHGWTGQFCDSPLPGQVIISHRCTYHFGTSDPSSNCTLGTRCLPEHLNCAFMPCRSPMNDGWCIPLAAHQALLQSFITKDRQYKA